MIVIDLNDKHLQENVKALMELKKLGTFSDEELQIMYARQLAKDRCEELSNDEESEGAEDENCV